jgi:hypothetical protein
LVEATEEVRKIRKSRQANMKGTWEKFKAVFENSKRSATQKKNTTKPKIVAAKCG